MRITRSVGDNYPITGTIKVNKIAIDITGSSIVFSYTKSGVIKVINGVAIDAVNGKYRIDFGVDDFTDIGEFNYKIKRIYNGITTTHLSGKMVIE